MCKRVRTLLRVSSRQQLHDDDIPIQREEARRYMEGRPDWIFDREYIEKAVSAYKNNVEEREVLQEILADAQKREFDVLLTYMSDRIGRQEEYSFYVATLNQLGIEVWTIKDGQLKTQEHTDKLLNYIRFWQNEGESKKTGMRVRDTQREMVRAGKFVGGRAPYGYQLIPSGVVSNHGRLLKKLEIVEERAQVVREIYTLAVSRGMGYERIARELNSRKIPAATTDRWSAGTVRGILTNPVYMGYLALNRRVSGGSRGGRENQGSGGRLVSLDRREWIYSERQLSELVIVPREIWERAQQIREARKAAIIASGEKSAREYETAHGIPLSTKGRLSLTGIVKCGYCGRRLKDGSYCNRWTTKAGDGRMAYRGRYVCPAGCRERTSYSQDYLEGAVFAAVDRYLEAMKIPDPAKELRELWSRGRKSGEKELERIGRRQRSLAYDIRTLEEKIPEAIRGDYCFSAEKLSAVIREKEREQRELDARARRTERELSQMAVRKEEKEGALVPAPDWKKVFREADAQTRKMLLSSMLEGIEAKDGEINIRFRVRPQRPLREIFA